VVINIDPNVVYGILVAIVLIILIIEFPRILRARSSRISNSIEEDPTERDTQQWKRDDQM
jgi:hypothetical protein